MPALGHGRGPLRPQAFSSAERQPQVADQRSYHAVLLALGGLIASWRLGEPSGTSAVEDIGGYNGVYQNTPTLGVTGALTGSTNTAVTFLASSSEHVTVANNAALQLADGPRTWIFWVNQVSLGSTYVVIDKGAGTLGTGDDHIKLNQTVSGDIEWSAAGSAVLAHTGAFLSAGSWGMVAVTYTGTLGVSRIYVNGVDRTIKDSNSAGFANTTVLNFARRDDGLFYLNGSLDEIALFGRALTSDEVAALYYAAPFTEVGAPVSVQPTQADLILSTATPTVLAPFSGQPTAAALTLTGATPTVATPVVVLPTVAALTLTGATPTVLAPALSQPTAAALVLTGATPTVATPVLVQPTAAALVITMGTPTVVAVGTYAGQPTAAALVLSTATPTVAAPFAAQPTAAALTLSTATPTVLTPVLTQPTAAALTLATGTPTVSAPFVGQPIAAALTLSAGTPDVQVGSGAGNVTSLPTAAALTLSTASPTVDAPFVGQPTPASLTMTAFAPSVVLTDNILVLPTPANLVMAMGTPTVTGGVAQAGGHGGKGTTGRNRAAQPVVSPLVPPDAIAEDDEDFLLGVI
jgi:hypothetical protein